MAKVCPKLWRIRFKTLIVRNKRNSFANNIVYRIELVTPDMTLSIWLYTDYAQICDEFCGFLSLIN